MVPAVFVVLEMSVLILIGSLLVHGLSCIGWELCHEMDPWHQYRVNIINSEQTTLQYYTITFELITVYT